MEHSARSPLDGGPLLPRELPDRQLKDIDANLRIVRSKH